MPPAIEFSGVTVAYAQTVALEDVSFEIQPGEFIGVIGPNGSGKTTLLKAILGLVAPVSGRVRVLGLPPARARLRIGYVPQRKPIDPGFPISVLDAVLLGTYPKLGPLRRPGRRHRERALEVLSAVGLDGVAFHSAGHISGGQQQRLFLARALVGEPEILLLDEPTAGVDAATRSQLVGLVRDLHQRSRLTTVYVTHDLNEVMPCVDRVMFLNRTVRAFGRCEQVLAPDVLSRLYGTPVALVEQEGRKFLLVDALPGGGWAGGTERHG